jgi:hypothetical protein
MEATGMMSLGSLGDTIETLIMGRPRVVIECYSVGGPENYRNLRALLLSKCIPQTSGFKSRQLYTIDPGPKWNIPAIPLVETMDASFDPNGLPTFPALEFTEKAEVAEKIECKDGDVVLIIGKTNIGFGPKSFPTEFLDTLQVEESVKKSVPIWIMGGEESSFNFSTSDVKALQDCGFENLNLVSDSTCPSFTNEQWEDLLANHYPLCLGKLNRLAIGSFFATRIALMVRKDKDDEYATDAFTRQFNLRKMCQTTDAIRNFELEVATQLHEALCVANTKRRDENPATKILELIHEIPENETTENALKAAIAAYDGNSLNTDEIVVLGEILRPKLNGAKEYDGFTAYSMIRSMAGIRQSPTKDELLEALKNGIPPDVVEQFHSNSNVKCIHVVHDLGLDPQSDDYNAVKLLMSLNNRTEALEGP